jgi:hypothetical protein
MHADLDVKLKGKDRFGCLNIESKDIDITDIRKMCRDTNGLNWLIIDSVFIYCDVGTMLHVQCSQYFRNYLNI